MFTNYLIEKINSLKEKDFKLFEIYSYQYQKDYLKKDKLRKADFKIQLDNFLSRRTVGINFDNLDAYVYALNQLDVKNGKKKDSNDAIRWKPHNLQELLFDMELPLEFNISHINNSSKKNLQNIISNLILACEGKDVKETNKHLNLMDEFIIKFIKRED